MQGGTFVRRRLPAAGGSSRECAHRRTRTRFATAAATAVTTCSQWSRIISIFFRASASATASSNVGRRARACRTRGRAPRARRSDRAPRQGRRTIRRRRTRRAPHSPLQSRVASSDTPGAGQRQRGRTTDEALDLGKLACAAEERREQMRQICFFGPRDSDRRGRDGRRAAASMAARCCGSSCNASTSSPSVSRCGALLTPRSSALIPSALIAARSASASCESPAARRNSRNSAPNDERFAAFRMSATYTTNLYGYRFRPPSDCGMLSVGVEARNSTFKKEKSPCLLIENTPHRRWSPIAHSFRDGARACRDWCARENSPAAELGGCCCNVRAHKLQRCRRSRPLRARIVSSHERALAAALGRDHGGGVGLLGAVVRAPPIQSAGFRSAQRGRRLHRLDRRSALRRPARFYDGHRVAALRGLQAARRAGVGRIDRRLAHVGRTAGRRTLACTPRYAPLCQRYAGAGVACDAKPRI